MDVKSEQKSAAPNPVERGVDTCTIEELEAVIWEQFHVRVVVRASRYLYVKAPPMVLTTMSDKAKGSLRVWEFLGKIQSLVSEHEIDIVTGLGEAPCGNWLLRSVMRSY